MPMILTTQIDTVLATLTDQNSLYFIPSFQRPYAWEAKQIDDLGHDMTKAYNYHGHHYLAALHFLSYEPANPEHPLANFAEYAQEVLQHGIQNGQLMTAAGPVNVYAVVDGQQRLTTLFLLAHILYQQRHLNNPVFNRQVFEVQPLVGPPIPRLILGNLDDQQFMMNIVERVWNPVLPPLNPHSAAQARMLNNAVTMQNWANQPHPHWVNFLTSPNFKALRVLLNLADGLTAFMTLNDRGKDLTLLEKLKALLLQYAYDAFRAHVPNAAPLVTQLQHVFGQIYRVIDRCIHVGLFSKSKADDDAVKLISCYLRLDTDGDAIWQGPDQAYELFFRLNLQNAAVADIPAILQPWCDRIQELADQLSHLVKCIESVAPYNAIASLHFNGFTLPDDYHATLISSSLQPHLLALLLRYRAQCGAEWHQRFPVPGHAFPLLPIHGLLADIEARARDTQPPPPQALYDYVQKLRSIDTHPRREISMIEVVERMQLANWNLGHRWYAGFQGAARAMNHLRNAQDCIQHWLGWCNADGFIANILYSVNDTNIRYLLKEMERERSALHNLHNLHRPTFLRNNISTGAIALEHIFAQNIDAPGNPGFAGFPIYGIADRVEYEQQVLWRSGNFTWLSETANIALGNQIPEIKAAHYKSCPAHPPGTGNNICSDIVITSQAGNTMVGLGLHRPSYRFYIEARCAELALFAVRRFC